MTNMNRSVLFAICLVLMLLIVSCTTASPPPPEPTATPAPEPQIIAPEIQIKKLNIAAGSITDEWHPWGTAVATAVTQNIPNMEMSVKNTSSRMEDLKLLLNGQVDLAFSYDYHIVLANQGKLMQVFPDAPIETLRIKCGVEVERPTFPDYSESARVVLPLYEQPLQLITTETTGIATINDLSGKRISIGSPNSLSAELAVYLLDTLGFDLANDITIETFTIDEAISALENGELDGFFSSEPVPSPEIAALFSSAPAKMVMIPIGEEETAQIMRVHPGIFHQTVMPANAYAGMDADVSTLAVTFILAAMEDFPDDQMEQVVSTLFESSQGNGLALDTSINLTPEVTISLLGADARTYLHPGSAAYFEQQGLLQQ